MPEPLTLADLDQMAEIMREEDVTAEGRWVDFQGRFLPLPNWFDRQLPAPSDAFRHNH